MPKLNYDAMCSPRFSVSVETWITLDNVYEYLLALDERMLDGHVTSEQLAKGKLEDCVGILQGILKEYYSDEAGG